MPFLNTNILPMVAFISVLLAIILGFLGLVHIYWAAGGTRALAEAMPPEMREQVSRPERQVGFRILTVVVALGLMLVGGIALSHITDQFPTFALPYRPWMSLGFAAVFGLRAVGDFKEVGLFSQREGDPFFVRDRKVYSPLCFLLAALWLGLYFLG